MIQVKDLYPVSTVNPNIYGFTIDEGNPDPLSCVQYTDMSINYAKGSANWDNSSIFKDIKPCLFKDGAVVGYLNKNDFSKFEDGTSADITSGNAGDVMVEVPKMAMMMHKEGTVITCKIFVGEGALAVDSRYTYAPFSRISIGDRSKIYIGTHIGSIVSNLMRSLSGKTLVNSTNLSTLRSQAQNKGTGYQLYNFFTHTLVQMLFVIKYGSLNSQAALGRGYVDGNVIKAITGGTSAKGMYYGETTGKYQMKFIGIEDLWGNNSVALDGVLLDLSGNLMTAYNNFNDTGSGYPYTAVAKKTSDYAYYITNIKGDMSLGFAVYATKDTVTENQYYCDVSLLSYSYLGYNACFWVGGDYNDASIAGLFHHFCYNSNQTNSACAGRLMYV